jgi:hypothetical protein
MRRSSHSPVERVRKIARFGVACCLFCLALATADALGQFPALVELATLPPEDARYVKGIEPRTFLGEDMAGRGDFNADGIADVVTGAPGPAGGLPPWPSNTAYVFFGAPDLLPDPEILFAGLDGTNGFAIPGEHVLAGTGRRVDNARDVNADGIDDLVSGAPSAGIGARGRAYVIFGTPGLGAGGLFDLSALDGSNGFIVEGAADGHSLGVVAGIGDLNADGYNDIAIGAPGADPHGLSAAGQTYILFGGPGIGSSGFIVASESEAAIGLVINGIAALDGSGAHLSAAGDVNADGYDDLLIGASRALPDGNIQAGQAYVVFGHPETARSRVLELADLDGTNGFIINPAAPDGRLGLVDDIGDVNADGIDDIGVGTITLRGLYVIFGGPDVGAGGVFDLATLDGSNGFHIPVPPLSSETLPGSRVDINHDGIDDLVVARAQTRSVYVFYGRPGLGSSGSLDLESLDGTNGFQILGPAHGGLSVAGAGDLNDDALDDLLVGSPRWEDEDCIGSNSWIDCGRFDVLFGRAPYALGDIDRDYDVDISDFWYFAACFAGSDNPPAASCEPGVDADFDNDGDVDLDDFAIFAQNFTGAM